jgi:hypothetical protein
MFDLDCVRIGDFTASSRNLSFVSLDTSSLRPLDERTEGGDDISQTSFYGTKRKAMAQTRRQEEMAQTHWQVSLTLLELFASCDAPWMHTLIFWPLKLLDCIGTFAGPNIH